MVIDLSKLKLEHHPGVFDFTAFIEVIKNPAIQEIQMTYEQWSYLEKRLLPNELKDSKLAGITITRV